VVFWAIIISIAILYKLTPKLYRKFQRWRQFRHIRFEPSRAWAMAQPEWPIPPPPPPAPPRRIAFDRETQLAARSAPERRIMEATVPQTGGPVLIAAPPRRKQLIISHAQARMIEEFVPDFAVQPGRWLYIGDWPEGWEDEE
jgi:hypothetical protein